MPLTIEDYSNRVLEYLELYDKGTTEQIIKTAFGMYSKLAEGLILLEEQGIIKRERLDEDYVWYLPEGSSIETLRTINKGVELELDIDFTESDT